MNESHARRSVEEKYGHRRQALLARLQAGKTPKAVAAEWGVHLNTIYAWMAEEGIRRGYVVEEAR